MAALLDSNPGLKSRFNKFIHFGDYTAAEMARLVMERAMKQLQENRDEHFGNARLVRNLLEHVQQEQANRLASVLEPTRDELLTVEVGDVERALAFLLPPASRQSP